MELYSSFLHAIQNEYTVFRVMKSSSHSSVQIVRHKHSGKKYVFRQFLGSAEVYRALLSVSCPYLPTVYEACESNGHVAVLEEYIVGDTLSFLLQNGVLSVPDARTIIMQLCQALYVLHSFGCIHRDIKPENIIVRGDQAILIDFNASRTYKNEHNQDTRVLGTTGYAAPEQYGISQCDARVDIFSLGVVLNLMLCGQHPSRILASGRMGPIVKKCTMTNPKHRYQSVLALMNAL